MSIDRQAVFQFLDGLRETGLVSIFVAIAMVRDRFEVKREVAKKLTHDWMKARGLTRSLKA